MRRRFRLALFMLCSASCASWRHPTKTEQAFDGDRANCLAKAGQATAGQYDPYSALYVSVYQSCMRGEGWVKE